MYERTADSKWAVKTIAAVDGEFYYVTRTEYSDGSGYIGWDSKTLPVVNTHIFSYDGSDRPSIFLLATGAFLHAWFGYAVR